MINTIGIARLMHLTPHFYGVMACNRITQFRNIDEASFILNTDPDFKPGEHWVGIYIKNNQLFFFDSFGRNIEQFEDPFKTIMLNFTVEYEVITESKRLQNIFNDSCGYWVAYYIFCKTCKQNGFDHFVTDTYVNESMLKAQMNHFDLI